ncbi:MAG: 30S ribosomal protein S6 [Chitinophagales bacterium]|jgi:small subunit ribosomal protein S6|nr:30S ribosomal protein S6 [Chitinophagales bacterium]
MNRYESTVIFTPILSEEDIKSRINSFVELITSNGGQNVHQEYWGLKKLAYKINKKSTGVYHFIEFEAPGDLIAKLELQFKRDESLLRFLTVKLDQYGVDYADRRKKGQVGKKSKKAKEEVTNE